MAGESSSYLKVNYQIRPSKQVERKLIIEILHKLGRVGLDSSDYTYVGLGSVYYFDFILFHKYLFMKDMHCYEIDKIPDRMDFNKPYDFVTFRNEPVSKFIPLISTEKKYFVWLDYDSRLSKEILMDIHGFMHRLGPGSIFVITIDADIRRLPPEIDGDLNSEIERRLAEYYDSECGDHVDGGVKGNMVTYNELPILMAHVIHSQITRTIANRPEISFCQLMNYRYADTAQMLSFGGIVCDQDLRDRLGTSDILSGDFVCKEPVPVDVSVPNLTVREKLWIDREIRDGVVKSPPPFEIREEMLKNYVKYYKQYPTFYETII